MTKRIATVIGYHCPMKPDVAYMPVPRCETCSEWQRGELPVFKRPSHGGVCSNPELRAFGGEQTIETAEDFGCVQWKEK